MLERIRRLERAGILQGYTARVDPAALLAEARAALAGYDDPHAEIRILITEGSQKILAEMYALGRVASFTLNMGSLLIYRYGKGTKEIRAYNTSRFWTLIVFVILLACFGYLAATKPFGLALWTER